MRAKVNFAGPSVFGSSVFGNDSNVFGNDSSVFGNIRVYLALPIHIFSGRVYLACSRVYLASLKRSASSFECIWLQRAFYVVVA